jgi:hypothetical protein
MSTALAEWRGDTDRLAQAKLRHAAAASREAVQMTKPRFSMPRLGGARLAFASLVLLLAGAGAYAYQTGMITAFMAMESAPSAPSAPETGAALPTPTQPAETVYVRSGSINIRAAAAADSAVIGTAASDTPLTVLGRDGNWIKIRIPGSIDQAGWVHTSRLDPNSLPPQ